MIGSSLTAIIRRSALHLTFFCVTVLAECNPGACVRSLLPAKRYAGHRIVMLENATLVVFGLTHILFLEGATHIIVCFRSGCGVWACSQTAGW